MSKYKIIQIEENKFIIKQRFLGFIWLSGDYDWDTKEECEKLINKWNKSENFQRKIVGEY